MDSQHMDEIFNKFKAWLKSNYEEGLNDLNPPATDSDIQELEQALGFSLPKDLAHCLRIHNGQGSCAGGLFDGAEFLSCSRILDEWHVWKGLAEDGFFEDNQAEPDTGIKEDWWNSKWIPFTYNGTGDHYCVDVDPGQFGSVGQVISMWHDSAERWLLADSFYDWFNDYVEALIAGDYAYSAEYGSILPVEKLEA